MSREITLFDVLLAYIVHIPSHYDPENMPGILLQFRMKEFILHTFIRNNLAFDSDHIRLLSAAVEEFHDYQELSPHMRDALLAISISTP